MASYKLIDFAFVVLIVLPNTLTMADDQFDDDHDDVPGVPDDDHDDDGPPMTNPPVTPTPTTPTIPPATPTTPTTPTIPPTTPTTPTIPPAAPITPTTPPSGNVCAQVDCGQGRCVLNATSLFGYKCVCEPGWRRTMRGYDDDDNNGRDDDHDDGPNDHDDNNDNDDDDDDDIGYVACLIPDCNMNYTCQGAPAPPMPPKQVPANNSVFDPCYWSNCGEGTCMKSPDSDYKHICQCKPGFNNLMNISYFPCYSNCVIGDDCARIGINKTGLGSGDDGKNKGLADGINTDNGSQAILPRSFYLVGTLMAMALALLH